ncbi:glutamine synthetase [Pseudoroseicyclus sp. CLL3-39]|uniref:Glutamine synthetase n=2 Tax=Pseudoroseicyclus tamaricis TaxID=2705421 RepID=A0A6B2K0G1_9RHOB|nr:glutamine synthetase [Pseudoroseicyclus tamaricis]
MQGRLMGKRFHAAHFLDVAEEGSHGCNYLLATDLEMETVQGYASTGWEGGYGDYAHRPDLSTLRLIPWQPATALVFCDFLGPEGAPVPIAPRSMLAGQVARARKMGFEPMMATELEFFLFEGGYEAHAAAGWRGLQPTVRHNIDYSLQGTGKDEPVMRAIRNGLYGAGVAVENSKGEAEVGQHEINSRYGPAMQVADNHALTKLAVKEIAEAHGRAATFMAKYATGRAGSSAHVHQSLAGQEGPAFFAPGEAGAMSPIMRSYLAGQLKYAREVAVFLAPYVNSYKRFTEGLFAPTKVVWSTDNRTAAFRVVGAGGPGVRVECRIGGADLNPYLALAALLAAGLAGIEEGLELAPEQTGDMYGASGVPEVPRTLREATECLDGSTMLRAAFGDEVVAHYLHAARWEIAETDRVVTDWDLRRGFERA